MADRIEREIEDILRKIDDFVPEKPRRPVRRVGQPFAAAQSWFAHRLARISMNQVMAWSVFVVIVAFFARAVPIMSWVMLAAVIVFLTALIFSLRGMGGGKPSVQKRWRGEPIDLSGPGWPDRVKAWIKGRRRA